MRPSGAVSGRLRIGTVSYLNAVPLIEGLAEHPDVELTADVPSLLADELAAGRLDVGMIPVIEVFRHGGYRIVPNVAIACFGEVWSVRLFSRVPIPDIRSVALDTSSRTSAALIQILLEEFYGIAPDYRPTPPVADVGTVDADAVLLIGDPAFRQKNSAYGILDCGAAWTRWTGLPFVFAVWAARPGLEWMGLTHLLHKAKGDGMRHLAALARRESQKRQLNETLCYTYFNERMRYDLDGDALKGLKRYLELARQRGLVGPYTDPEELLLAD